MGFRLIIFQFYTSIFQQLSFEPFTDFLAAMVRKYDGAFFMVVFHLYVRTFF